MTVRTKRALSLSAAAAIAMTTAPAHAQLSISWYTIDGGGGTSTGGAFTLTGTIGQPDAGAALTAGGFSLSGGFWTGAGSPPCRPDLNADGQVNVQDYLAYLQLYSSANPRADFNADAQVNVQDYLAFLAAYALGC
jgi:hypothetical protein